MCGFTSPASQINTIFSILGTPEISNEMSEDIRLFLELFTKKEKQPGQPWEKILPDSLGVDPDERDLVCTPHPSNVDPVQSGCNPHNHNHNHNHNQKPNRKPKRKAPIYLQKQSPTLHIDLVLYTTIGEGHLVTLASPSMTQLWNSSPSPNRNRNRMHTAPATLGAQCSLLIDWVSGSACHALALSSVIPLPVRYLG